MLESRLGLRIAEEGVRIEHVQRIAKAGNMQRRDGTADMTLCMMRTVRPPCDWCTMFSETYSARCARFTHFLLKAKQDEFGFGQANTGINTLMVSTWLPIPMIPCCPL